MATSPAHSSALEWNIKILCANFINLESFYWAVQTNLLYLVVFVQEPLLNIAKIDFFRGYIRRAMFRLHTPSHYVTILHRLAGNKLLPVDTSGLRQTEVVLRRQQNL